MAPGIYAEEKAQWAAAKNRELEEFVKSQYAL